MDQLEACRKILTNAAVVKLPVSMHRYADDWFDIEGQELLDLLPYMERYGYEAIAAYCHILENSTPDSSQIYRNTLTAIVACIDELRAEIANNPEFLADLQCKHKVDADEIEQYGSKVIVKGIRLNFVQKLFADFKSTVVMRCSTADGRIGYGDSINDACADLRYRSERFKALESVLPLIRRTPTIKGTRRAGRAVLDIISKIFSRQ